MAKRKLRDQTEYIVVHWAVSPADPKYDIEDIRLWHREQGYISIGYHFVIPTNGDIQEGEDPRRWGAHVRGYNDVSVGICLIGGLADAGGEAGEYMAVNFTDAQLANLKGLLDRLQLDYPDAKVVGHHNLDPEGKPFCPGFDVHTFARSGLVCPIKGVADRLQHHQ